MNNCFSLKQDLFGKLCSFKCEVSLCFSDYVIEEKTAVLQKRESEGFGFVLRGAKGRKRGRDGGVVGVWRKKRREIFRTGRSLEKKTPTQSLIHMAALVSTE